MSEINDTQDKFEEWVMKYSDHKYWDLWMMAFLCAMNTHGSFRSFLRQIHDGTVLDWWLKDFTEDVVSHAVDKKVTQEYVESLMNRYLSYLVKVE